MPNVCSYFLIKYTKILIKVFVLMPYQKEDEVVVGEYDLHDKPQGQLARWSQAYSHNTLTSGSDPWIRTTGRW